MNIKIWLPFLLAPVIGGIIGVQLFNAAHDEPVSPGAPVAAAPRPSIPLLGELVNIFDSKAAPAAQTQTSDAAADFATALSLPPGPARRPALQAAYTRWTLQAPALALAGIDRIPADERQVIVANALATLARQRPEQFLTYANGITGNYATYMAAAMTILAESNPSLALELVTRNQGRADPHGVIIGALLPTLLRSDLALAAQTVAAMKDRASVAHIQQVAAAYAKQDPRQAYDWVSKVLANRTDIAPSQVLNDISGALVAANPTEAANYLSKATDPAIRKSLLNEISIQKGQEDLTAAWTWLNQYKADENYGETATNLLYRWSYSKPEEVAKILPMMADAQMQSAAASHLSHFWQKKDPAAYRAWVASLPPGAIKTSALEHQ